MPRCYADDRRMLDDAQASDRYRGHWIVARLMADASSPEERPIHVVAMQLAEAQLRRMGRWPGPVKLRRAAREVSNG